MKHYFYGCLCFCWLSQGQLASAQLPSIDAGLSSSKWSDRARAFARPEAQTPNRLLRLLRLENAEIDGALRASNGQDGVSSKYGEEYGEYYADVLSACRKICDRRDPATIRALAEGAYSPSSPLANELATRYAGQVLSVMLERIESDLSIQRVDALEMLQRIGTASRNLTDKQRELLRHAVAQAGGDASVVVRLAAIDALGAVGSSSELEVLKAIVNGRVTLRDGGVVSASVTERRAATEAMKRIERR